MGDLLQPMHLLVIGIIVLVLFGGKKLPSSAKAWAKACAASKKASRASATTKRTTRSGRKSWKPRPTRRAKMAAEARLPPKPGLPPN